MNTPLAATTASPATSGPGPGPRTTSRHPHVAARGQLVRGQPSRSWAGTATVTEPTGSPSASPHAAGRHPDPRNQVLALSTL